MTFRGPRGRGHRIAALVLTGAAILVGAAFARAQGIPRGVLPDTVRVPASAGIDVAPVAYARNLVAGDRVAVWVDGSARVGEPNAGGLPVPDAPPGALVARFSDSGAFAWPGEPVIWTAPRAGPLSFGLNGRSAHALSGSVRVLIVPLAAAAVAAFPPPAVDLRRSDGSLVVEYRDRAGFGLDRRTLAFTVIDAHGTTVRLPAWAPAGETRAILSLPPPVELPPGVHSVRAEITDRLGRIGVSGPVRFDAP